MNVFTPGDHGSTFGGNALAAAVGLEALKVLAEENLIENSAELGAYFMAELKKIESPLITEVRGKGLFIGVEIDPSKARARDVCLALLKKGLLSKETHETVVRLAPPLIITRAQLDQAVAIIKGVLQEMG
jgi:ornithine--oxo-acid transaminase